MSRDGESSGTILGSTGHISYSPTLYQSYFSWTEPFWKAQFSSVAQSCLTFCDSMDCSTPGLPVHYQLPEFTQTHVHWVAEAIQPFYPLSSSPPPAFNLSQHQGLFPQISCSRQMTKILEFQLQHQSFLWIYSGLVSFRTDWLDLLTVQGTLKSSPKSQFKSINSLALSLLHSPALTSIHDHRKNHSLD